MSSDEIINLQQLVAVWYDTWIGITWREGMPNYVHMLGSGHVMYYLRKKLNLYRYSNQSWERLNKRLEIFYLTKTQRGEGHGHYNSEASINVLNWSHTFPLAR